MYAPFRHAFNAMTTRCEMQFHGLPTHDAQILANRIQTRVDTLVARYNFHDPRSWLNREVNGRRNGRVRLDDEIRAVLCCVREHALATGGVFDITVGTYSRAVRAARSFAAAQAARDAASPWLGLSHWWLEDETLVFDNPHTCFDLGGVIKEYAVDEARRQAEQAGVAHGLINFGGDLAVLGRKPDGTRFVAAVPDPEQPEKMLFGLDLENQALTTSGHYARQRTFDDGVQSHILGVNRAPRWTSASVVSASVVSSSALVSGIYSTALMLNPDIPLPPGTLAVTIDAQRQIHTHSPP